jgi:hypothetical protein
MTIAPNEKLIAHQEYKVARLKGLIKDMKANLVVEEEALAKLKYGHLTPEYNPTNGTGTAPDGSDIYSADPPTLYPFQRRGWEGFTEKPDTVGGK